ncbi:MAG: gamma-glutamylcyclotransferase [Proteobacteria bacterium]|nr:gamma-glutamylcyclotransferase [Pseudomonadota bacterium]
MTGTRDDIWVFAYGSLMWHPGFAHVEARPAWLRGYHRAFCIYSYHYRGTAERPGLVLGLDRGGSCRGMAFRVAADEAGEVLAYLEDREHVLPVYERRVLPVSLGTRRVPATTYLADRKGPQYAGKLAPERIAHLLVTGAGRSGTGIEYLENTVRHLDELGIPDRRLHALLEHARRMAAG